LKIIISALPENPWWGKGTPQYADNPAMVQGTIPNQTILESEWKKFYQKLGKYSQELDIIPFPSILDGDYTEDWKHDFVFARDLFVSNKKNEVVIARFKEKERQAEEEIIEEWVSKNEINYHKLPYDKEYFVEGGEFYFCPNENILFAGSSRNNSVGNNKTAELLNVHSLVEIHSNAFHLDTLFTPVFNEDNSLCMIIACTKLMDIDSKNRLLSLTKKLGIDFLEIQPEEAIGSGNNLGSFAVNCLPLQGVLLGSAPFTSQAVNSALKIHNITHSIIPLTQFRLSGGSVHCLTNEI